MKWKELIGRKIEVRVVVRVEGSEWEMEEELGDDLVGMIEDEMRMGGDVEGEVGSGLVEMVRSMIDCRIER